MPDFWAPFTLWAQQGTRYVWRKHCLSPDFSTDKVQDPEVMWEPSILPMPCFASTFHLDASKLTSFKISQSSSQQSFPELFTPTVHRTEEPWDVQLKDVGSSTVDSLNLVGIWSGSGPGEQAENRAHQALNRKEKRQGRKTPDSSQLDTLEELEVTIWKHKTWADMKLHDMYELQCKKLYVELHIAEHVQKSLHSTCTMRCKAWCFVQAIGLLNFLSGISRFLPWKFALFCLCFCAAVSAQFSF